jgi:hypothetical protein
MEFKQQILSVAKETDFPIQNVDWSKFTADSLKLNLQRLHDLHPNPWREFNLCHSKQDGHHCLLDTEHPGQHECYHTHWDARKGTFGYGPSWSHRNHGLPLIEPDEMNGDAQIQPELDALRWRSWYGWLLLPLFRFLHRSEIYTVNRRHGEIIVER